MNRRHRDALVCSFPPIVGTAARVLILGSVPSVTSLARQQYYGHAKNAFWPIMGRLFGAGPDVPYDERKRILTARGVAVWDVLRQCYREGSLDADIRVESESPNDFVSFLTRHRRIHTIFFNGRRSEVMFGRHVRPTLVETNRPFRYILLPSTSPAHAARGFDEKLAAWQAVVRELQAGPDLL